VLDKPVLATPVLATPVCADGAFAPATDAGRAAVMLFGFVGVICSAFFLGMLVRLSRINAHPAPG
jgi:hypothetical protein